MADPDGPPLRDAGADAASAAALDGADGFWWRGTVLKRSVGVDDVGQREHPGGRFAERARSIS